MRALFHIDSVERAFREERFALTPKGEWRCAWCGRTFPPVTTRQQFDTHLRVCTTPAVRAETPWPAYEYEV